MCGENAMLLRKIFALVDLEAAIASFACHLPGSRAHEK